MSVLSPSLDWGLCGLSEKGVNYITWCCWLICAQGSQVNVWPGGGAVKGGGSIDGQGAVYS